MADLSIRNLDDRVKQRLRVRAAPDPGVLRWLASQRPQDLRTTAITVAEVRFGIERLPAGNRRRLLTRAAEGSHGRRRRIRPPRAPTGGRRGRG